MSDTVFLVNPASANGSTGRRWAEMAHSAATKGLEGDTLFSERPGQLGDLARNAADGGAKLLVVVGGDGSVNEVANGIAERDVEVAVIARGTGWDFARSQRIPRRVDDAVDVALNGATREAHSRSTRRNGRLRLSLDPVLVQVVDLVRDPSPAGRSSQLTAASSSSRFCQPKLRLKKQRRTRNGRRRCQRTRSELWTWPPVR